jgi:hypothetical protein
MLLADPGGWRAFPFLHFGRSGMIPLTAEFNMVSAPARDTVQGRGLSAGGPFDLVDINICNKY